MRKLFLIAAVFLLIVEPSLASVRLKEIARIEGVRENPVVGYGLLVGLAGTGDTNRSKSTTQSVINALANFGVNVAKTDISSRNAAAVMLTANLPAFAESGTKIDVAVSSIGDARSLVGGTLLLAPLKGVDGKVYVLAQGQVSVGGYQYEFNGNRLQKNHPTVGVVPLGGIVERAVLSSILQDDGSLGIILNNADYTTASRVEEGINNMLGGTSATAVHAGRVNVRLPEDEKTIISLITQLENMLVDPDHVARIVVNERTGTIVTGGDVRIDDVTVSHANIKVSISTTFTASQPQFVTSLNDSGSGISTVVVPNTEIDITEKAADSVNLPSGATIADVVTALKKIHTSTRDIIIILQAVRRAGALHAELIIQ